MKKLDLMRNKIILCFLWMFSISSIGQKAIVDTLELQIPSSEVAIKGTLLLPKVEDQIPLLILIQGSGPTDRNGNQLGAQNNSLKYLAENLARNNMAVFRYDKKMFQLLKNKGFKEENLSFDNLITDAIDVIDFFKSDQRFSKIIVVGHSQGSLVGMIASQLRADAFISIAGAGRPINETLQEQLVKQVPNLEKDITKTLDSLKVGKLDKNYNKMLTAVFRESVQPFLISWIKYNPQEEIKKLTIPVLIINGTKDLQTGVNEAELLHQHKLQSKIVIIENMNHVLKNIEGDIIDNYKSYTNPELDIENKLISEIVTFVNSL